jgi:hypothetical protein
MLIISHTTLICIHCVQNFVVSHQLINYLSFYSVYYSNESYCCNIYFQLGDMLQVALIHLYGQSIIRVSGTTMETHFHRMFMRYR